MALEFIFVDFLWQIMAQNLTMKRLRGYEIKVKTGSIYILIG